MKIAQITPYFHPHLGGVESHVRDLSIKLSELGHEVDVITSEFEKGLSRVQKFENFTIHRLKTFAVIAKTPIMPGLKKFLKNRDYDVIHAHSPPPLACHQSAKASEKLKIPFVYTYHCDMEIPFPLGKYIVSIYRHLFERGTIKRTNALICTTGSYAATSRSTWDREINVIPNAVDIQQFHPSSKGEKIRKKYQLENKTVVMFVGRIVHHKGIETLLRSAIHTDKKIHYLIVGDGEDRERLEKMSKEIDKKRITFTGPVPGGELPNYYGAADILVLPSLSRLEAFGIVGLEAMATSKPVILSGIPGVSEVITPGTEGLTFEPSSQQDLGKCIMELHDSPEKRKQMGRRGRERVEREYSMVKVAKDVENIYKSVISGED